MAVQESPSARRAWIEILTGVQETAPEVAVALRTEGVDRNDIMLSLIDGLIGRPPHGGRG